MATIISIITDWGHGYGAGHVQRMASLCRALDALPGFRAEIVNPNKPGPITGIGGMSCRADIDRSTGLVVRDMRDSTRREILSLGRIAPVLAVDDIGEGRGCADHVIDLLPSPLNRNYRDDCYLYGHNFMSSLRGLSGAPEERSLDVLVYAGHDSTPADEEFFASIVPVGARSVVLGSGRRLVNMRGDDECARMDYAALLLRTKVFISHFGISLFEARLAGCSVIALNPTPYHSSLADMVAGSVVDLNAGERSACDPGDVSLACGRLLGSHNGSPADPESMLARAQARLDKCRDFVVSLAG